MPTTYRIYRNDGVGGPIDYSSPIATTSSLSFATPPLSAPGDHSFGVRVYDSSTGIEEANTDARARIILDSLGRDVSSRPNKPFALHARPTAGGGARVGWYYNERGEGAPPFAFDVFLTQGNAPLPSTPTLTVVYLPKSQFHTCELSGLSHRTEYVVTVRARGSSPEVVGDAISATVTGRASPPDDVEELTATVIP